jgi:hypothetical protein
MGRQPVPLAWLEAVAEVRHHLSVRPIALVEDCPNPCITSIGFHPIGSPRDRGVYH